MLGGWPPGDESRGEATLRMLHGTVRLDAGDDTWRGAASDHVAIPPARHDLTAENDVAVLLTVATRAGRPVRPPQECRTGSPRSTRSR